MSIEIAENRTRLTVKYYQLVKTKFWLLFMLVIVLVFKILLTQSGKTNEEMGKYSHTILQSSSSMLHNLVNSLSNCY